MGYDIFKFGMLFQGDQPQHIPTMPNIKGDIPAYDGKTVISLDTSVSGDGITWIKSHSNNLLVADRVLLANVSWEDLDKNGFVTGKTVLLDGQRFHCRLLQVGEKRDVPNEWDKALDETGEDDDLWHWVNMYFDGADISVYGASYCAARGYFSARSWNYGNVTSRGVGSGFRPALEPLPSDNPVPNINLDGIDFRLTSLPGSDTFCPIMQPTQGNVFKDIPVGGKSRMYTFMEDGRPIHMDEPVKDPSKLTLTDRYFGDEYLVPWVISNGVAVARQSLNQQF